MYLQSLSSAFPATRFTQPESWQLLKQGPAMNHLKRRSVKILETVLNGSSGIDTRHFAIEPRLLFTADAETLNREFERTAPPLGVEALRKACALDGADLSAVDALFVCTCSGYLCPGVSSHIAGQAGLRPDTYLYDTSGLGCGAALPTMHAAECFLKAYPGALVATVAVEVCSAAFYLDDDTGVLVSACLFGDGAAAALWRSENGGGQWEATNFHSLHRPEEREKIRFVNTGGKLRNQLHRSVPDVAAEAVVSLFEKCGSRPDQIIAHTGGRDVIEAIEARLPYQLAETRESLRKYGNLSSPSVLCALEDRLAQNRDDRFLWVTSFGAGFAAHSCELRR